MSNDEIKKKQQDRDTIDVLGIFRRLVYYWPLFLIMFAIAIGLGYIYLRYATPVYVTRAKIYIKDVPAGALSSAVEDVALGNKNTVVENEMELIRSPILLEEVIREGSFNIYYFLRGKLAKKELYKASPIKIKSAPLFKYSS